MMGPLALHQLGRMLAAQGRGRDRHLVHVNDQELAMLRAHGGSGRINPVTGLMEFADDAGGGGDASGGGNAGAGAGDASSGVGGAMSSGGMASEGPGGFSMGGIGDPSSGFGVDAGPSSAAGVSAPGIAQTSNPTNVDAAAKDSTGLGLGLTAPDTSPSPGPSMSPDASPKDATGLTAADVNSSGLLGGLVSPNMAAGLVGKGLTAGLTALGLGPVAGPLGIGLGYAAMAALGLVDSGPSATGAGTVGNDVTNTDTSAVASALGPTLASSPAAASSVTPSNWYLARGT